MEAKSPVKEIKRSARRNLVKVPEAKRIRATRPLPSVESVQAKDGKTSVADNSTAEQTSTISTHCDTVVPTTSTNLAAFPTSSDIATTASCTTVNAECHVELSQDTGCSPIPGDLPRVMWQSRCTTSPVNFSTTNSTSDKGKTVVRSGLSSDDPLCSTPYLSKVWDRDRPDQSNPTIIPPDMGQATSSATTQSISCTKSGEKTRQSGRWLNEMFNRVSQLEDNTSQSPPPVQCSPFPATSFSRITGATAQDGRTINIVTHIATSSADGNSGAFSDSMDFTSDFALSDEDNSQREANSLQSTRHNSVNQNQSSKVVTASSDQITSNSNSNNTASTSSSNNLNITESISTGTRLTANVRTGNRVCVKTEPSVKSEPTTPPTETTISQFSNKRRQGTGAGSPGTLFRRYNSHDSLITSPKPPAEKIAKTTAGCVSDGVPTVATTSASSSLETPTGEERMEVFIERKRMDALRKLKSRTAGTSKGSSFVRHRSFDSATKSQSQEESLQQKQASQLEAKRTMDRIVEENRQCAAERLQQRHADTSRKTGGDDTNRERSDSLSGTLRQLTPPSSQDTGGESSQPITSSQYSHTALLSHNGNNSTFLSGQASKLTIDALMKDLEDTPKPAVSSSSQTQHNYNFKPGTSNAGVSTNVGSCATAINSTSAVVHSTNKSSSNCGTSSNTKPGVSGEVTAKPQPNAELQRLIETKRLAALQKLKQSKKALI